MTTKETTNPTTTTGTEKPKTPRGRNTKKDTPTPTPLKTIEIPTNGISNGKKNYFTLTFNKKMMTTPFFPTQHGQPGDEYPYSHHLNGDLLDTLGKKFNSQGYTLFSYDNRKDFPGYETITTQTHGDLMKYNLYKLIQDGTQTTTHNDTLYKMTWIGNPIPEPTIKHEKPKKEKSDTKPTPSELEGLDFTDLLK